MSGASLREFQIVPEPLFLGLHLRLGMFVKRTLMRDALSDDDAVTLQLTNPRISNSPYLDGNSATPTKLMQFVGQNERRKHRNVDCCFPRCAVPARIAR